MAEAYIVSAVRTAGGRKGGRLKDWHPADLGGKVLDALVDRTDIDPALIEDVIVGCVGQAGEQGANVARNVVLASLTASAGPRSRRSTLPLRPSCRARWTLSSLPVSKV